MWQLSSVSIHIIKNNSEKIRKMMRLPHFKWMRKKAKENEFITKERDKRRRRRDEWRKKAFAEYKTKYTFQCLI